MTDRIAFRARRVQLGLTQAGLAAAAGVSRQLVVAVEAGVNTPAVDAALRLAAVLDADVEALFGGAVTTTRAGDGRAGITEGCFVIAGCDPALRLAETSLAGAGPASLVALDATTDTALAALCDGGVHAAVAHGPHGGLPTPPPGTRRMHLASWQVGIGLAPGCELRTLEECLDRGLSIVQRQESAAAQQTLRRAAAILGGAPAPGLVASGHNDAARAAAALGTAAITTEGAATRHGLHFIPLESHTVEIWFGEAGLGHPGLDALGEVLGGASFKRSAKRLGGYDLTSCGDWLTDPPI